MQEREFRRGVKGLHDLYWLKHAAWQTAFKGEGDTYQFPFQVTSEEQRIVHQHYQTTMGGHDVHVDYYLYALEQRMEITATLIRGNKQYTVTTRMDKHGQIEVFDRLGTGGRRAEVWNVLSKWQSLRFNKVPKADAPAFRDGPRATRSSKSIKNGMMAASIMLGLTSMPSIVGK